MLDLVELARLAPRADRAQLLDAIAQASAQTGVPAEDVMAYLSGDRPTLENTSLPPATGWLADYLAYTQPLPGGRYWHLAAGIAVLNRALGATRLRFGPLVYGPLSTILVGRSRARIDALTAAVDVARLAELPLAEPDAPHKRRRLIVVRDFAAWQCARCYSDDLARLPRLISSGTSVLGASTPARLRLLEADSVLWDWVVSEALLVRSPLEHKILPSEPRVDTSLRRSLADRLRQWTALPGNRYASVPRAVLVKARTPTELRLAWTLAASDTRMAVTDADLERARDIIAAFARMTDKLDPEVTRWEGLLERVKAIADRKHLVSLRDLRSLATRYGRVNIRHALAILEARGEIATHYGGKFLLPHPTKRWRRLKT